MRSSRCEVPATKFPRDQIRTLPKKNKRAAAHCSKPPPAYHLLLLLLCDYYSGANLASVRFHEHQLRVCGLIVGHIERAERSDRQRARNAAWIAAVGG